MTMTVWLGTVRVRMFMIMVDAMTVKVFVN
jgi:hypothetical protein